MLAGFYVEDDGRVNPVDAASALARGAKRRGARLVEGVSVTGVKSEGGRVTGVQTSAGDVACEHFVNAAGMWARQLGALAGVSVPNQAAEHYYLLTEPMADVGAGWPVVEDPSRHTYIRPEGAPPPCPSTALMRRAASLRAAGRSRPRAARAGAVPSLQGAG